MAVVKHAFQSMDAGGSGAVSMDQLQKSFNAGEHPRVRTREKRAETVFNDFMNAMAARASPKGMVSEQAFFEYYADINACLPAEKEDYFIDCILKTWNLSSGLVAIDPKKLEQLEITIFEKIRQKTHGAEDEGRTVKRIFKHFDLDGYGTIEPNEFKKSLETIGCTFKDHEIDALFRKFDANGNGKLDYEEFASFFARMGSGNNPNVNPVFGASREPPNQVIDKVKQVLLQRGGHGIRGLGIVFRRMDNNRDKRLDRYEFQWGLKENGHTLSPSEFERIFKFFDKDNNGKINYDEFLRAIRGDLNERRRGLVHLAFKKLDRTGDGVVTVDDISKQYNV